MRQLNTIVIYLFFVLSFSESYANSKHSFHSIAELNFEQHRNEKKELDGFNSQLGLSLSRDLVPEVSFFMMPKILWRNNLSEIKGVNLNEVIYKLSGKLLPFKFENGLSMDQELLYVQDLGAGRLDYYGNIVTGFNFTQTYSERFKFSSSIKYERKLRKKSSANLTKDYYAFLLSPSVSFTEKFSITNVFRYESVNKVTGLSDRGYHLIPALSYIINPKIKLNLETTLRVFGGQNDEKVAYNQNWKKENLYNLVLIINNI